MLNPKMTDLGLDERELIGGWVKKGDQIVADPILERVEWLIKERLQKLGKDWSGWFTVYRDPSDGRYWEHFYPQGYMHGGGPAGLRNLTENEVRQKYASLLADD